MQELTMFFLESCPYCRRALGYMRELRGEDPRYEAIPVRMVEEQQEKALADSYNYYYVPCYYAGGEKIAEGSIDKEGVRRVFDTVLAEGS